MLDTMNMFNVIGAFMGIASAIIAVAVALLVVAFVKKLPIGIRRFVSTIAAVLVALAFFRGIAIQTHYILLSKALLPMVFLFKISDVAIAFDVLFVSVCFILYLAVVNKAFVEGLSFGVGKLHVSDNDKKQSSSFQLKVSSVLLQ